MSDSEAHRSHMASRAHHARLAEYEADPKAIIQTYSNRLADDMAALCLAKGSKPFKLEGLYKEYILDGKRGGIVYLEATRWKDLNEFGRHLAARDENLEWNGATGEIKCRARLVELMAKASSILFPTSKRALCDDKSSEQAEPPLKAPLLKKTFEKAILRKVLVNAAFGETAFSGPQLGHAKPHPAAESSEHTLCAPEANTPPSEDGAELKSEVAVSDVFPIKPADFLPWLQPGLLVHLKSHNCRALVAELRDPLNAYCQPLYPNSSDPPILVHQHECKPIVEWLNEGLMVDAPVVLSAKKKPIHYRVIRGDHHGKQVGIVRWLDRATFECVNVENRCKITVKTEDLCQIK